MIVQYFDVIHCKTQEQVTAVINKLHSEQGLTWMHDDECRGAGHHRRPAGR